MNTVLFDSPFDRNAFLQSNKVFWEYRWSKRKKQILYWAVLFILFLALGIWRNTKGNEPDNFYIFIVVCFGCIVLFGILEMIFSRRKQKRKIEEAVYDYENTNSEYIIQISEEGVEVRDFQSHIALKWAAFKNFVIFKEHIILIPKNYIAAGILINKNTDGLDKYNQALTIVESRLMEYK